ncbi:MAG: SO_0444 family Cu/Zn efflux transporter [Candidatus Riflebacteria bacterium]|nr:SO_0444 family Cu/Zn efflux transporter [Candidatus Riflebacteria bacterium]
MPEIIVKFIYSFWEVFGQMAPYLLFGFIIAGILSEILSPEWVEKHLGGKGFWPIFKSSMFGIPLPLCSCGVVPVAASIYRNGASRGATASFLLSTPEIGIDSMLATYSLLGIVIAVYRPLVAFFMGITGGLLVDFFDDKLNENNDKEKHGKSIEKIDLKNDAEMAHDHKTDCGTCKDEPENEKQYGETTVIDKLKRAIWYGLYTLPKDLSTSLLIGIVIAALISTFVQANAFRDYLGGGFSSMLIMLIIGIPIYVCSTSSIPMALGFMHLGASPGAALVFLISGPATNGASIMVVFKMFGRRLATVYLLTIAVSSILAGYSLDILFAGLQMRGYSTEELCHSGAHSGGIIGNISAVFLLFLLIFAKYYKSAQPKEDSAEKACKCTSSENSLHANEKTIITLNITGMSCQHCANTVSNALNSIAGVKNVTVDVKKGISVVTGSNISESILVETVEGLGYSCTISPHPS